MRIPKQADINVWVHQVPDPRIDEIIALLKAIVQTESLQMAEISDLATAVAEERTVIDSAVALLDGLSAQLAEALANDDPAAVQAVLDQISANRDALAAAVEANTPGTEPAPEPPPEG